MWTAYYQKNKEKHQKEACKRYQNLSEEEKHKKWEYWHEQYKNLSEDEKQQIVENSRSY